MASTRMNPPIPTVSRSSWRTWLWVAGALLILAQLAAMGYLAATQVSKAQSRDSLMASQRQALAQCFETTRGAVIRNCGNVVQALPDVIIPATQATSGSLVAVSLQTESLQASK
jgi:adenosylmethionine-8-amino-7-oxononanoate aminotransferase